VSAWATPHPFARLVEIATEAGLPRRFPTDLHVHDLAWLLANPNCPFGWILYEGGTHLHRRGIRGNLAATLTSGADWPGSRYFVSEDGSALREVTAEEWSSWMTEPIDAAQWLACDRRRHEHGLRRMLVAGGIVQDYAETVVAEALRQHVELTVPEVTAALHALDVRLARAS